MAEMLEKTTLETLSARLIDSEFRDGFRFGYRAALTDLLARCEFLLARTAALSDLRNSAELLRDAVEAELAETPLPYEDAIQA